MAKIKTISELEITFECHACGDEWPINVEQLEAGVVLEPPAGITATAVVVEDAIRVPPCPTCQLPVQIQRTWDNPNEEAGYYNALHGHLEARGKIKQKVKDKIQGERPWEKPRHVRPLPKTKTPVNVSRWDDAAEEAIVEHMIELRGRWKSEKKMPPGWFMANRHHENVDNGNYVKHLNRLRAKRGVAPIQE